MTWKVINTRTNKIDNFEDVDEAIKFYNKTCVDLERNNGWEY